MKRELHVRSATDRQRGLGRLLRPIRATFGQRGAHSRHPKHIRTDERGTRRLWVPIVLFSGAFVLASGSAALAYVATSGSGTGKAQAIALSPPGVGSASEATTTSLSLSWEASAGLPAGGGYVVLRSASSGGPYAKVSSGTCNQVITLVSTATSCTDTGLTVGTTYYYEVEAGYYDLDTLWVSEPDAQFSGATNQVPANSGPTSPAPAKPGSTSQAPAITSANSTSFFVGAAGTFQVTASGTPAPTFSNQPFNGCTPSTLPPGVSFSDTGLLSGTPGAAAVGTYTVCVNAENGVSPNNTQSFTLTIETEALVISSPAVSGASSSTPNLGPITVRRQTGSGTPITTGGDLKVNLTSSPSAGASFGGSQFASTPVSIVTIPNGESSATFWYGSPTTGTPTITASATNFVSGTQTESITTAPAGLGIVLATGSTGSPVISCGPPTASSTCKVTGVGSSGSVVVSVAFWDSGQGPVVYSATQGSTINESGQSTGSVDINAGASGSGSTTLTASAGTSTLTFGPYRLTINVS